MLNRQQIVQSIEQLPTEALAELPNFINYLQFKTSYNANNIKANSQPEGVDFLLKIAGIAESTETDLSETDEEILSQEINNISGWSLKN
ncbi:hypothetical protein H6F32_11130 [Anabaena sp. FACHB-1237]|nr:hypothetical protein [Anabaena sp. FACHB-1237]